MQLANALLFQPTSTGFLPENSLGIQSRQFLWYYHKDPNVLSLPIDATYFASGKYKDDLYANINFIQTCKLNRQLHDFLLGMGYAEQEIAFILDAEKISPKGGSRSEEQRWEKYYTPELKQWVRYKERMIFELFPGFDV